MPLYEHRCEKCGEITETIQKFSDPPLTTCEACGGKLERLLSSSSIQFKGSGWYVNDYGKTNGQSGESKESSEKPKKKEAVKSSDSKSTSKTEKDTPAK
ncbi:MAG: FmdB family zinc ribbon protein [Acidobacteriota bacterium]